MQENVRDDDASDAEAFGFGMTDLEEQLAMPDGDGLRRRLIERFSKLDQNLTRELAVGVAPDRYRELEILRRALASARTVLVMFKTQTPFRQS